MVDRGGDDEATAMGVGIEVGEPGRTIEREITGPLDMPRPWAKRSATRTCADWAVAAKAVEMKNSARPASSTGLRPCRSDTGPHASWPIARPSR